MTTKCGWCITGDHHQCKPSVSWEGRTWVCNCSCHGEEPITEEVKKPRKTRSDKGVKRGPRKKKEGA